MRYRLLGPLEVEGVAGDTVLRRTKVRALLALLLLNANRLVSKDALVDGLWGDDVPKEAQGALQNYVSQLRKLLSRDTIVTERGGYRIVVSPDELDVEVFERLVASAADAEVTRRAELLREALALWHGPALADLTYEPFAGAAIQHLEGLRLVALDQRIAADLELGRHAELVPELEAAIRDQPLREHLRALLMLALYRSGRQADALDAYRDARAAADELGLEPGEELQRLERAILHHDPAIAAPAHEAAREPTRPAARPGRRTVTVVFADVTGSTALGQRLDPETLREVMASFFGEMRIAIERHGGTVEKFAGDEVMAVFGAPVAHEDDALRAVRAAEEMNAAVTALDESLERGRGLRFRVRIGVNTGEVVAGEASAGGTFVTGSAVNLGKRIQELAQPGETILSGSTMRLVRDAVEVEDLGPVEVRGSDEPVEAYRLLAVRPGEPGVARAFDTPLVGREKELSALRSAFALAREERRCVFVSIVGAPGIGKTRIARELVEALGEEARVLVGRCVAYGTGATYLPLVDALTGAMEQVAELLGDDEIGGRLASLVRGEQTTATAADTAWAARRAFEALARDKPLLLVFDDVHWGEPTFLDLLEYLGAWIADAPVLLLAVSRPDLLESRPTWADPESGVAPLRLAPLSHDDTRALVDNLAAESVSDAQREQVTGLAEGYPLFAEQLVAWVEETGGQLDPAAVPPTVEALLASRLDRLDPGERAVLERAAVIGRDFWRGAVASLMPPGELAGVGRHLLALVRKAFVRPAASELPAEDALRFHHALIRDVAYAAIPKALRAELHERCADWLDANAGEPDEVVGYHLEEAYRYRIELGDAGRITSRIGADAGERLGRAGVGALARGDAPAAISLLTRATGVLPAGMRRIELLVELGVSQRTAGRVGDAEQTLQHASAEAAAAADRRLELRSLLELKGVELMSSTDAPRELLELVETAVPVFEALNDHRALGRAWFWSGFVNGGFLLRNAAYEEASERALHHYRRAGWPTATCLHGIAAALFYGPRPASSALARIDELLDTAVTDRVGETHLQLWRGGLLALQGDFAGARAATSTAREIYEEVGQPVVAAVSCGFVGGLTEMLAGDFAAAEQIFRESCLVLESRDEWASVATRASEIANSIYAQGRFADAAEWIELARRHSTPDDLGAEFPWRSVLAKLTAEAGEFDEAERLAREAVELVDRTDSLNQRAEIRLDLAHVLRSAGRDDEAAAAALEGAALYEMKENVVGAERARRLAGLTAAV
jgi:class 3 adenylate cyclase/DNA-binding winged helix-turn-helix (wHTH) protein